MLRPSIAAVILSPLLLALQCSGSPSRETTPTAGQGAPGATSKPAGQTPFAMTSFGSFSEPWAAAFAPGTSTLFVTEKRGKIRFVDTVTRKMGTVYGAPPVDYGGQGGLGDIAFLPSEASSTLGRRTIYLSWAEAGEGDTRGAAAGSGTLVCEEEWSCRIEGLRVIWRQSPKVTGRGHFSHRFAVSPDGNYLYISSGDRQKFTAAQDTSNNIGSIVRLNLDGTPATGNPFSGQAGKAQDIWSWGHRNLLGLDFDAQGRLWDIEHGPKGGDELNLVEKGKDYGWPAVSNGDHYDGRPIPRHSTRPEFAAPAISWNPVIAPGDFIFYRGTRFNSWRGQAVIAGMKHRELVRVAIAGNSAREVERYPFPNRLREIVEGPDGAIWLLEDSTSGRLLRLMPR